MKKTYMSLIAGFIVVLMLSGAASAASCYPTIKPKDGTKVYWGTYPVGTMNAHVYARAYTNGVKAGAEWTAYLWKGKKCVDDEYVGRAGANTYIRKDDRTCIDSLYVQFKKNSNSWPTINIPGGWCGKPSDVVYWVSISVAPYLMKNGAADFVTIATKVGQGSIKLPWPGYPNPSPVPTLLG